MRVRDLERLLSAHGVGAAKMDATTRKLRESGRLPTGGRGPNAPAISAVEAANILLAVAGSSKAIEADTRLGKLAGLRSSASSSALVDVLAGYLTDPSSLREVSEFRVARTRRRAAIHFRDGHVEEFVATSSTTASKFFVEGILPAELIEIVAAQLHGDVGR